MGYDTAFTGHFTVTPALSKAHIAYLQDFASVRHMRRDAELLATKKDPLRTAVGLPLGKEGAYFIGTTQRTTGDKSILDLNKPPLGCPDLYCQWVPSKDGKQIKWDGNEKFRAYLEWLRYLVANFLSPWGYEISGEVRWQ